MEFENKVAIITGAASGMGLLTSRRLAEKGAKVVMIDINKEALEKASLEINANCTVGATFPRVCDLRDYDQIKAAAEFTIQSFGRIDITASFAGGSPARVCGEFKSFNDMSKDVLDWGIDVNFKAPIYLAHCVMNKMIEQNSGVIINIGSVSGEVGGHDADYGAAKSGLIGFTRSLALIGGPHNVRSVCISPGPVLTRAAMANMKTPLGRAAEVEELVNVVLFMASDKASFITGSDHIIDGGRTCGGFKYGV